MNCQFGFLYISKLRVIKKLFLIQYRGKGTIHTAVIYFTFADPVEAPFLSLALFISLSFIAHFSFIYFHTQISIKKKMALKLYGAAMSPCTSRVMSCLHEKEADFELISIDLFSGEHKQLPFLAKNVNPPLLYCEY